MSMHIDAHRGLSFLLMPFDSMTSAAVLFVTADDVFLFIATIALVLVCCRTVSFYLYH